VRVSNAAFDQFMVHARKLVPSFTVHDGKEDSYLMNLIDGIIFPFNPRFLQRYITTVISHVWFPKGQIKNNPRGALEVAGHELVHAYDAKRLTFPIFGAWYLFPLVMVFPALILIGLFVSWLAFLPFVAMAAHLGVTAATFKLRRITGFPLLVLSLLGTIGLMAWQEGWSALWLASTAVLLAPLPAPGRKWAELRGYGMSIFLELKLLGRTSIDRKVRQFTGPAYYFMWPFAAYIRRRLEKYEADARAGRLKDPVFVHVQEFFDRLEAGS
jgi:hypothetical protein